MVVESASVLTPKRRCQHLLKKALGRYTYNLQQMEEKALDKEEGRAREERKGGIGRLWE